MSAPQRRSNWRPSLFWLLPWLVVSACCFGLALTGNVDHRITGSPVSSVDRTSAAAVSSPRYITEKIRDLPTGTWVLADNPETDIESDFGEIVPDQWRHLRLQMVEQDGATLDIELLRPLWWMNAYGAAAVGDMVELDLHELAAAGPARILHIQACPEISPRPSPRHRLVTGKFIHRSADVLDLAIEGLDEPIGVTANHPFWSEDRQAFVPAAELRTGELLSQADGSTNHVVAVTTTGRVEAVYNLEVDGEHVYYVSESGVLVHNACTKQLRRALNQPVGGGDAHHIVAAGATNIDALRARDYLSRAGISTESTWNGVMLSKSQHRGIHTSNYYKNVANKLERAYRHAGPSQGEKADAMIRALDKIRNQLLRGDATLWN